MAVGCMRFFFFHPGVHRCVQEGVQDEKEGLRLT